MLIPFYVEEESLHYKEEWNAMEYVKYLPSFGIDALFGGATSTRMSVRTIKCQKDSLLWTEQKKNALWEKF